MAKRQSSRFDTGDSPGNAGAINNEGQAVGYYYDENNDDIPFIWDVINGLVTLPGIGYATDLNNEGQVVGTAIDSNILTAALWQDGLLYDLNDLLPSESGWDLESATSINDLGQIVGTGTYDGETEGFLVTPGSAGIIPEPSALIFAAGFPMLFRRRHRRRTGI